MLFPMEELLDLSASCASQGLPYGRHYRGFSIQIVWTGTPTGDFTIETTTDDTNWDPLEIQKASADGSGSSHTFRINLVSNVTYRVKYTRVSGTGTCTMKVTGSR